MDLEGINSAVNPNQMKGQNAVVLAMLANRFGGRRGRSVEGGGKDKSGDQAKLLQYQSELKLHEEAQKAWIKTQADERAANFATENLPEQISAARKASEIRDDEGNLIGEVGVNSKTHGISTGGYRLPKKSSGTDRDNEAAQEAVADTVVPQAGSQQGVTIPGWGLPAAQPEEPEVSRAALKSAMKKGPKKRVTAKARRETTALFSDGWEYTNAE